MWKETPRCDEVRCFAQKERLMTFVAAEHAPNVNQSPSGDELFLKYQYHSKLGFSNCM